MSLSFLVPVDFSESSGNALEYAVRIASELKATITVFNSFHISVTAGLQTPPVAYLETIIKERETYQVEKLESLINKFQIEEKGSNIQFSIVIKHGLLVDTIGKVISENDFDFIVMGTKGASGLRELFWGSITAKLIDKVQIPILAIPEKTKYTAIKKALFAINFKKNDVASIQFLKDFLRPFQSELNCLHIVGEEKIGASKKELQITDKVGFNEKWEKLAIQNATFLVEAYQDVETGLHHYLETLQIDLLAITPQKHSFLDKLLHQSISKQMLFHSDIPVLILRER